MKMKLDCVLLVEDDEASNYLSKKVIEASSVASQVHVAWNGSDALAYLTKAGKYAANEDSFPQPNLILLDINMPVMDGWDFIEEYRKLRIDKKSDIIVVMLTTSLNPDDKTRAKNNSNIADFKNKPLTQEMLEEIMHRYFDDNWSEL